MKLFLDFCKFITYEVEQVLIINRSIRENTWQTDVRPLGKREYRESEKRVEEGGAIRRRTRGMKLWFQYPIIKSAKRAVIVKE